MKNRFMLLLQYYNFDNEDKEVRKVLTAQQRENALLWQPLTKNGREAIYLVQGSLVTIGRLKRNLDQQAHYKSVELFEYRCW